MENMKELYLLLMFFGVMVAICLLLGWYNKVLI